MFEVERTKDRCIFLIENNNLKYYIIVPFASQVKLLLGFIDNVDNQKIKDIPVLSDKVVVVPVVSEAIINYLTTPQQSYRQALDYFTSLINNSYGLLSHNRKQVDQVVLFNNDERFSNFIDYFVSKAPSRVQKNDRDLFKVEKQENISNFGSDIPVDMKAYPDYQEENIEQSKPLVSEKGEPGFVSYVLLGVVIAILSLVFLYMLI